MPRPTKSEDDTRRKRVDVFLNKEEFEKLERLWKAAGFASRSDYIRRKILDCP